MDLTRFDRVPLFANWQDRSHLAMVHKDIVQSCRHRSMLARGSFLILCQASHCEVDHRLIANRLKKDRFGVNDVPARSGTVLLFPIGHWHASGYRVAFECAIRNPVAVRTADEHLCRALTNSCLTHVTSWYGKLRDRLLHGKASFQRRRRCPQGSRR
jgi:hypothetical protein